MANERLFKSEPTGLFPTLDGVRPQAQRLLETAVVAFAERGYNGVSVRDLTGAVGIKPGSFYSHYPSKEALLFELQLLGHRSHHAHVRDAILAAGPDPTAQLRDGMRANVWFQATYPLLTIVANSDLHALSPDNRARIMAMRRDFGVLMVAVVERGISNGVFQCEHPWLAVYAMGAMGIRVAWWFRTADAAGAETPLSLYSHEATSWIPDENFSLDQVCDSYADYALKIVSR
jgi:AcrR family transcriptional regulator